MNKMIVKFEDAQPSQSNNLQGKHKKITGLIVSVLVFVLCFFAVQRLFTPKYMSAIHEGALISEYYRDIKENQVIFIGDCEVYESFSPIRLWEEYGITSYIRGAPQQLIWQSYYILEDTLRYETPDVVVLGVLPMKYDAPQSEAYNRLNLDGMRLSPSKIKAIKSSMTEGESLLSYIFPIFRYHDRWRELSRDDLLNFTKNNNISHNGYYMHCGITPVEVIPAGQPLADYSFSGICYTYLDRIAELCAKKGIRLVLIKAPGIYPHWYPQWDRQIASYAGEYGLLYLNLMDLSDEIGIDFSTDTYDGGLHMNLYGAEKLSDYFGRLLRDDYKLPDMRGDERLCTVWEKKSDAYYTMMSCQLREIAEHKGDKQVTAPLPPEGSPPSTATSSWFEHPQNGRGDTSLHPRSVSYLKRYFPYDTIGTIPGAADATAYAFVYRDTAIVPGTLMTDVLEVTGKPLSVFEAPSCVFVGVDKIYNYLGFRINTYPKNGKDFILSISFTDDSVRTKEGICLGMVTSDIEAVYGAGTWNDSGNLLSYLDGGVLLSFLLENDEIIDITYYFVNA